MPAYNAEKFIEEAIISVIQQEYSNWTLYIYNDGSTDGTKEIICKFAIQYPEKIKFIDAKQNMGVAFGLNILINAADGDYVCWLSADDMYMPNMLKDSVEFLENNLDYGWVFSDFEYIDENSEFLRVLPFKRWREELKEKVLVQPYYRLLTEGCCMHGCTVMYRRTCHEEAGMFSSDYPYAQDYDMWLRLAAEYNVGYINRKHVRGREYSTQTSMQGHNEIDAIKVLFDFICDSDRFKKLYTKAGMKTSKEALYNIICGQLKTYKNSEKELAFLLDILQNSNRKILKEFRENSENAGLYQIIDNIKDNVWNEEEDFFSDNSFHSYLKALCDICKVHVFFINNQAIRFERFKGNTLRRFNMGMMRSNDIVYGRVKRKKLELFLQEHKAEYRYYFSENSNEEETINLATSYYLYKNSNIVKELEMYKIEITNKDIWWELIKYIYS